MYFILDLSMFEPIFNFSTNTHHDPCIPKNILSPPHISPIPKFIQEHANFFPVGLQTKGWILLGFSQLRICRHPAALRNGPILIEDAQCSETNEK